MRVTWRKRFERIRLLGPSEEKNKMLEYCYSRGFCVVHGGPKRISAMRIDSTRYVVVAEREINE